MRLIRQSRRVWRSYWLAVFVAAAIWLIGLASMPVLIRLAYEGKSVLLLNRIITGQASHSVEDYLATWQRFAMATSVALIILAVVTALALSQRQRLLERGRQMLASVPALRVRDTVVVAVAVGTVAGIAEAVGWLLSSLVLHRVTRIPVSADLLWMSPLSATLLLVLLALLIAGVVRIIPSGHVLQGATPFLFCALSVYGLGRTFAEGVHPVAMLILSVGLAMPVSRFGKRHTQTFLKRARWTGAIGAVAVAVFMVGLPVSRRIALANAIADSPPARAGLPNIILIIWDTVRAANLSLYGYARPTTPTLEKLAHDAVVFDRAVTSAPWTLPAHASLFTGLYHHEHSADRESPLDRSAPTLAEVLHARGYQTGGFIANTFWVGSGFGLDRGFSWYEERFPVTATSILSASRLSRRTSAAVRTVFGMKRPSRITAERTQERMLRWLDRRDESKPFFAFLNQFDAHEPYDPPGDFGFLFSEGTPRHTWSWLSDQAFSPRQLQELREAYDACIYYLDHQLGQLLAELERRDILDNTLIVVTSDHGETIGEHSPRIIGHENNIYFDVVNVPLIFYWPEKLQRGVRVATPVSLVDVAATVVDLVNDTLSRSPLPGTSLAPLLTGANVDATYAPRPALSQGFPADYHLKSQVWPMAKGPLFSLVTAEDHYIINSSGDESLFNTTDDPWENVNLVGTTEGEQVLDSHRAVLRRLVTGARLPSKLAGPHGR